jgi:hypothetical protein
MSVEGSKEFASDYGLGGGHDMLNSEQYYGLNKEVPSVELLNIQAKKASSILVPRVFLGKILVLSGHVTLQKLIAKGGVAKYQITCLKMLL